MTRLDICSDAPFWFAKGDRGAMIAAVDFLNRLGLEEPATIVVHHANETTTVIERTADGLFVDPLPFVTP
jgi:hypothetical protein